MHAEALLSRKWLIICLLMGSSEYITLFFLCLHVQLFLHLLNSCYLDEQVVLPSFCFLSVLQKRGVTEWLCGCLAVG